MSAEEFETTEFKERIEEATERALEAQEHRSRWLIFLSFSTALIAVFAAIAALESGAYSNEALLEKNEALMAQSRASDQWAYYQAKSVKAAIFAAQAAALKETNPDLAEKDEAEASRYGTEEQEISKTAKELEGEVKRQTDLSEKSMEHHHHFAFAVTLFQISIALAAVSALSRKKVIWYFGLIISVFGFVFFLRGF